ncbi:MAG: hypothetical protein KIT09_02205 [Bryobacteraceae bacterium]|nr:hypothetical protein [Bryobacteraceae bacterium]
MVEDGRWWKVESKGQILTSDGQILAPVMVTTGGHILTNSAPVFMQEGPPLYGPGPENDAPPVRGSVHHVDVSLWPGGERRIVTTGPAPLSVPYPRPGATGATVRLLVHGDEFGAQRATITTSHTFPSGRPKPEARGPFIQTSPKALGEVLTEARKLGNPLIFGLLDYTRYLLRADGGKDLAGWLLRIYLPRVCGVDPRIWDDLALEFLRGLWGDWDRFAGDGQSVRGYLAIAARGERRDQAGNGAEFRFPLGVGAGVEVIHQRRTVADEREDDSCWNVDLDPRYQNPPSYRAITTRLDMENILRRARNLNIPGLEGTLRAAMGVNQRRSKGGTNIVWSELARALGDSDPYHYRETFEQLYGPHLLLLRELLGTYAEPKVRLLEERRFGRGGRRPSLEPDTSSDDHIPKRRALPTAKSDQARAKFVDQIVRKYRRGRG